MKKSLKKLSALLVVLTLLFSLGSVPASAVNVYEDNKFCGYNEVYDYGNEEDKNFFEKIKDTFHWYIARIFFYFEADCPICGEHFLPPDFVDAEDCYNDAVNALKNYKGTVTVKRVSTTDISVNDAPSVVASVIGPVCENLAGTTENTYTFIAGKTLDGKAITDVVEPMGRKADLSAEGVHGSFTKFTGDELIPQGLSIQLVSEAERFDGTSMVNVAAHNASVMETINLGALDLGPIKIHEAEGTYTGTEIYAGFDNLGRITSIKLVRPYDLYATGKMGPINATVHVFAETTEEYTITYVS